MLPDCVAELLDRLVLDDDDIRVVNDAVEVDNDNDPAPENVPEPGRANTDCEFAPSWGHNGICNRKSLGLQDQQPKVNFPSALVPTLVDLFELFFPKKFIEQVMIPQMNQKTQLGPIHYGEFIRWCGIWHLMSMCQGPQRHEYWRNAEIDYFSGAPFRLGEFMSRNRFDDILSSLTLTNVPPPPFVDKFHNIRLIADRWNQNMAENFSPAWITCLDESMSVVTNKYTCPGFMFVPRKPHPFGNEWHSICCGVTGVMFAVELVEGKDAPKELSSQREYEALGKTTSLLLRLTKSIHHQAKVLVVLYSGFCVLKGRVDLRKQGVFAASVVKKRRYWPRYVDGDAIKEFFVDKEVGDADAWAGTLHNDVHIRDSFTTTKNHPTIFCTTRNTTTNNFQLPQGHWQSLYFSSYG